MTARLEGSFLRLDAVRHLVRDLLGCGCPEDVFDDVLVAFPASLGPRGKHGARSVVPARALQPLLIKRPNVPGRSLCGLPNLGFQRFDLLRCKAIRTFGGMVREAVGDHKQVRMFVDSVSMPVRIAGHALRKG